MVITFRWLAGWELKALSAQLGYISAFKKLVWLKVAAFKKLVWLKLDSSENIKRRYTLWLK